MVQERFDDYIEHLKYHDCISNLNDYFDKVKDTNFDIIHNSCRGDSLKKSIKEHQTICKSDFNNYLNTDIDKTISAAFRKNRDSNNTYR